MKRIRSKPSEPGLYWLFEDGEPPFIVDVGIESDSHGMFFVRIPDDEHTYPFEIWPGARWLGPLEAPSRSLAS